MPGALMHRFRPDRRGMAFMRCFMRSYLIAAAFNSRGMQNVGYAYAMDPGLKAVHHDPEELRSARKRYISHFNSHPFWAPCLLGVFLHAESLIAQGRFPAKMLEKVKDTTGYTLSAIGDSVFAGSLLIFWSLSSACLLMLGRPGLALAEGLFFFLGLQAFRVATFLLGLRKGFKVLEDLRRWNLIDWGQRLKYVNAGLLLCLWFLIWPRPVVWWEWGAGCALMALAARLLQRRGLPRELVVLGLVLLFVAVPLVAQWIIGRAG